MASPEKRFTAQNNTPLCDFPLGVITPAFGDRPEEIDAIKVIVWRDQADEVVKTIKKGDTVVVVGRLQINNYTTQDGQKKRSTELVADSVERVAGLVAAAWQQEIDEAFAD